MKKRRLTLIFLLSLSSLYREEIRNYTFIPLLFFLNALIVFGNFPFLILISNKRPMFVDDLFIKDRNEIEFNLTDIEKQKFEKRFNYMLILSNSLFVAALADYFFYETLHIRDESYVGMLGITGGIIKIFGQWFFWLDSMLAGSIHYEAYMHRDSSPCMSFALITAS